MSAIVGYMILVAVGIGMIGVFFKPHWAVVLVIAMYTLKQLMGGYLPIFLQYSPLFNFLTFAVVVAAVVARYLKRDAPLSGFNNGLVWMVYVLYFWVLLGVLWTPGNGAARAIDGYPYWIMNVTLLPMALLTVEDFRKSIIPLLIVGLATIALFAVHPKAGWYAGRFTIYVAEIRPGDQVRGNPLAAGQFGGTVAIAAALVYPLRKGWLVNIVRFSALFAGLGLAIASGSRAQATFAAGTMVLFWPLARRVKSVGQFLSTIGGAAAILLMIYIGFQLFIGLDSEQWNRWNLSNWGRQISSRVGEAWILVDAYVANPQSWLQGLGTNAYSAISGVSFSWAHNVPIELLCENGVIGLALYLIVVVLAFKACADLFRLHRDDPAGRAAAAVLIAISFYMLLLSMKQTCFITLPEPIWVWVLIAKFVKHEQRVGVVHSGALWPEYEHDDQTASAEVWDGDEEMEMTGGLQPGLR